MAISGWSLWLSALSRARGEPPVTVVVTHDNFFRNVSTGDDGQAASYLVFRDTAEGPDLVRLRHEGSALLFEGAAPDAELRVDPDGTRWVHARGKLASVEVSYREMKGFLRRGPPKPRLQSVRYEAERFVVSFGRGLSGMVDDLKALESK